MWGRVARGDFTPEVTIWLAGVGARLLEADRTKATVGRDRAIVRAVGLSGVADRHETLRSLAEFMDVLGYRRKQIVGTVLTGVYPTGESTGDGSALGTYKEKHLVEKIVDAELAKTRPPKS